MAKMIKDYLKDIGPAAKKEGYALSADDLRNILNGGECEHDGTPISADPKALKELESAIDAFNDESGQDEETTDNSDEEDPEEGEHY